ncbi:hypothetical protein HUJ05_007764 [Dendroctonus ponderosae]|nr:hypothetical protein HUJ05_007764 [Dendroctonus ponderosae]
MHEFGIQNEQWVISMVCYADDTKLFAESENDLQRQSFKFYQISQQLNMDISIGCLKETVWANPYMRKEAKIKICKICRPIMRYGDRSERGSKQVAEMSVLRIIAEKTRKDHVRNTDIRTQCGIQDVVRWGMQTRRESIGKSSRDPSTRDPAKTTKGSERQLAGHISENITEASSESTDHLVLE